MAEQTILSPSPEVQHLPTLFRRVRNGELRIPAFQRGFVWTEQQILSLLDSVYRGYPIGSLLLWKVNEPILKIESREDFPFPEVATKYPMSFVLDGMQRISTLYGVFHYGDLNVSKLFDVHFDLLTEKFTYPADFDEEGSYIPLAHLFSPREFLRDQQHLIERRDGELLIDRAIKIHSVFQEYMLPLVTIEGRTANDVVQIFERVNSTGMSLSSVDFMRAVTWSEHFDLNQEISGIRKSLENIGFQFDDETVVKVMAVILGRDPTPNSMLTLRQCSYRELLEGVETTEKILVQVVEMLRTELNIGSTDYIPYQGQVLVLAKMLASGFGTEAADLGVRWFIATGLNEALRGKPDNYLIRVMNRAAPSDPGRTPSLDIQLALDPAILISRRFIRMRALSAAVATLFSIYRARSIFTGEIIDPATYMSEFTTKPFVPIWDQKTIENQMGASSSKLIPNMMLVSEHDAIALRKISLLQALVDVRERFGDRTEEVLDSQFISEEEIRHLEKGDASVFLFHRSYRIMTAAGHFLAEKGQPQSPDTR